MAKCYYCQREIKEEEDSPCDDDEEESSGGTCSKCYDEMIDEMEGR